MYLSSLMILCYLCCTRCYTAGVVCSQYVDGKDLARPRKTVECSDLPQMDNSITLFTEINKFGNATIDTLIIDGRTNTDKCLTIGNCRGSLWLKDEPFTTFSILTRLYIRHVAIYIYPDESQPLRQVAEKLQVLHIINATGTPALIGKAETVSTRLWPVLSELYLDLNYITAVPVDFFLKTPKLSTFSFSYNCAPSFGSDTLYQPGFSLETLTYLDMGYNAVPGMCGVTTAAFKLNATAFAYYPNINHLSFAGTGLNDDDISSLTAVPTLSANLKHLDLSANKLTKLPGLSDFRNLRTLNISHNLNLLSNTNLDSMAALLPAQLEALRVRNISLKAIPWNLMDRLPKLAVLDVRNNRLTSFPNNLTEKMWGANSIYLKNQLLLQNNALLCDCNISYLAHWLAPGSLHRPSGEEALCRMSRNATACPTCLISKADSTTQVVSIEGTEVMQQMQTLRCVVPAHNENSGQRMDWSFFFVLASAFVACVRGRLQH